MIVTHAAYLGVSGCLRMKRGFGQGIFDTNEIPQSREKGRYEMNSDDISRKKNGNTGKLYKDLMSPI